MEQGEIVGSTVGPNQRLRLTSMLPVQDFELAFEAKCVGDDERAEAFLVFHYSREKDPSAVVALHKPGELYDGVSTWKMLAKPTDAAKAATKAGNYNYNAIAIRSEGRKITVTVNGVLAAEGEYELPTAGRLYWNLAQGCKELWLRNIRFQELLMDDAAALRKE